jgi:hypothetical protein
LPSIAHSFTGTNVLAGMARVFVFEPAQGIQASLLRTLRSFPDEAMNKQPKERSKMYFLLAWLHAVIQERLRCVMRLHSARARACVRGCWWAGAGERGWQCLLH